MKTTVDGKEIYVFVSAEQRWFSAIFAAILKVKVSLDSLVLFNGYLTVNILVDENSILTIFVKPLSPNTKIWKSTNNFDVGFRGPDDTDDTIKKCLNTFFEILQKFDHVIPNDLAGYAYIGIPGPTGRETLLKMFPFITIEQPIVKSEISTEILARVTSKCNQCCPFCSGPKHSVPSQQTVYDFLDMASELLPNSVISLTGGEPTLRASFSDEVLRALSIASIEKIQIQTNALNFATKIDPSRFPSDGRILFFISLHAMDPKIYDACTGTKGQYETSISGIRRILRAGHDVILNTVVCKPNINHIQTFIQSVADTFSGSNRPQLHFSTLICQEWNTKTENYLVKYNDIVPVLDAATKQMQKLGFSIDEHLSSTYATTPRCIFPIENRSVSSRRSIRVENQSGYNDYSKNWVKSELCKTCVEDDHCLGVPMPYAKKFGLLEFSPITHDTRIAN